MNHEKFTSLTKKEKPLFLQLLCLLILARDGRDWCYDIYKKLKKNELPNALLRRRKKPFEIYLSKVGLALNELASLGLIRKGKKVMKLKKGHRKRMYYITFHGLLYVLEFYKESWRHIDEIAKKHADKLPLIFRQWEYFGEKGVKDKVIEAMRVFCKAYAPYQYTLGKWKRTDELFLREDMTRSVLFFYLNFITLPPLLSRVSQEARQQVLEREKRKTLEWVNIWLGKPKLKQYLTMELGRDEKEYKERLNNVRFVKEYIENLKSTYEQHH